MAHPQLSHEPYIPIPVLTVMNFHHVLLVLNFGGVDSELDRSNGVIG